MEIIGITRSKLRGKLLKYYFMHPQEKFYLRQLEKLLGLPIGNIRRELNHLEMMGLFSSEKIGNLLYYSLNKRYSLYKEIKSIVFKTLGMGDTFRQHLKKIKGIEYAFIYGSFAKGEETGSSDIDFMAIGNISQEQLLRAIHKIEEGLGREINPMSYSLEELKGKIKKKNYFILNVLREKKIMLIGEEDELSRLGK